MNTNYEWQNAYLAAILETDQVKLVERIEEATKLIQARVSELEMDHGGAVEERTAIADALTGLRVLRRERT